MKGDNHITFESEAALCQAFIRCVPDEWTVYPETAGWDILLVHRIGGWQIGVEAKQTLNAKVLCQAIDGIRRNVDGPDFRAVLVGRVVAENAVLARALGLTVITPKSFDQWRIRAHNFDPCGPRLPAFNPELPKAEIIERIGTWWSTWSPDDEWKDQFPACRHKLPDYVPEVAAGVPSPLILSDWKIKAMRVCVWVCRNGTINRAQFKALGIDPSRWMNGYWLVKGPGRGDWVAGPQFPGKVMQAEHPSIWTKIEADYAEWSVKVPAAMAGLI